MLIGYARISTHDQNLDLQTDALKQAGCERLFTDKGISGAKTARPGLNAAWDHLRAGDTLIVWKLDRLGRSLPHLVQCMANLEQRGIHFRSLTEGIDTSTSTGRLVFGIFGAIAQFERDLIRERTQAGLAAARARGKKGGRKPAFIGKRRQQAQRLIEAGQMSYQEIADLMSVSKATIYRLARTGTS